MAWPVSMKYINSLADAAKKRPTYTDENGKEVEYDDTWYVGEQEIIITPMTDAEMQQVLMVPTSCIHCETLQPFILWF